MTDLKQRFEAFFDRRSTPVQMLIIIVGYFIILTPVALAIVVASPFLAFVGAFGGMGRC